MVDLAELRRAKGAEFLPPAAQEELEALPSTFGSLPGWYVDLIGKASGLDFPEGSPLRFTQIYAGAFEGLFPTALELGCDAFGNYAVLDISRGSPDWGPVYYLSHDPPSVFRMAPDLTGFLEKFVATGAWTSEPGSRTPSTEDVLDGEQVSGKPAETMMKGKEPLAVWAGELPAKTIIFDMSGAKEGDFFPWDVFGPDSEFYRFEGRQVFAVAPEGAEPAEAGAAPGISSHGVSTADVSFPCLLITPPSRRESYGFKMYRWRWSLLRKDRWPEARLFVPGFILDSAGSRFDVEGVVGIGPKPFWAGKNGSLLEGIYLATWKSLKPYDLRLSPPRHLSLDEFKAQMHEILFRKPPGAALSGLDRGHSKKLLTLESYKAVIEFVNWYQSTDGREP